MTAAAATAVAASLASEAVGWRPTGPMFAVFAVATTAAVPARARDLVPALLVSAAVAVLSVLIGLTGRMSSRHRDLVRARASTAGSPRTVLTDRAALLRAARYAVAVLVAGSASTLVGVGHPSWAMVAAVVPPAAVDTPKGSLRAIQRVVGTGLGLAAAWGLLATGSTGWALVALIVALQFLTELFVVRNYGFAMIFVTPLALLMSTMGRLAPIDQLLRDRAVETVVGALVGLVLTLASGEHRRATALPVNGPTG